MDRTGRLWRAVASYSARKRELLKELAQPAFVFAFLGIDLRVSPFEITGSQDAGRSMPWPCHEDHVQVVLLDEPIQMDVDERQAGAGAPMSQKPVLDVFRLQRLFEQRIVPEINHSERQVFARSPVGVNFLQFVRT